MTLLWPLAVNSLLVVLLQPLLSTPFRERRRLLREVLPPLDMPSAQGGARLKHVTSLDSDCSGGRDEIETFWEVALDSQCEGLMIKVYLYPRIKTLVMVTEICFLNNPP